VLSVAKLARGREGYYLATVASGREEAGVLVEPEGRWIGQAAAALGLVGTVDGPGLRALLAGVDPVTGEVLSARHDSVRVAAYDCTYSTPKSVSVLHALGPEEVRSQVRAGHLEGAAELLREAVEAAVTIGDPNREAVARLALAQVLVEQGSSAVFKRTIQEGLEAATRAGNHEVASLENSSGPGKLTENGPVLTTG
jgi:conjugative relaxase-like TrwC/TraI family protein